MLAFIIKTVVIALSLMLITAQSYELSQIMMTKTQEEKNEMKNRIDYSEEWEGSIEAGSNLKVDYCLRCKGDSMINARIFDGDIVFIKQQPVVENGEIAAVIIEDEVTLKRVYFYPEENTVMLQPENPRYRPLIYSGSDLERIRILGKAIAFHSDIK